MGLSFFFFFKQKTAYDMRISDWSSDVCSSDLALPQRPECPRRADDRQVGNVEMGRDLGQLVGHSRAAGNTRHHASCAFEDAFEHSQLGRASCRERVCKYV